ncbi:MAG: asparagine synthase C-terminal domain-containing protein [Candidatus Thorarchaeota archaeon]
MTGIICRIGKTLDTQHEIHTLLELLGHRGKYEYIREFEISEFHTGSTKKFEQIIVGIRTTEVTDPVQKRNRSFFIIDSLDDTKSVLNVLDTLNENIGLHNNSVVLRINNHGLVVARSQDGQRAIYVAEDEESVFLASEKKCLWYAGLNNIRPIEPNEIYHIAWNGGIWSSSISSPDSIPWKGTIESALVELEEHLRMSMSCISNTKCGVLFSGGVDSSLIANVAKEITDEVILLSAGTQTSRDKKQTAEAAELLNMELIYSDLTPDHIWNLLPEVIYAAETCNKMDVEIAIPFFVSASRAKQNGIELILSGQGPDELFAGYAKHVQIFQEQGPLELSKELMREVSITHEANISRDERVIAANGVQAIFPYLDPNFSQLALTLPSNLKVNPGVIPERKVVFRQLAIRMGLPEQLALTPKKATQFSSGSSKILTASIAQHSGIKEARTMREAEAITQDVLNRIGFELGLPIREPIFNGKKMDLEPTYNFIKKKKLNLQQ